MAGRKQLHKSPHEVIGLIPAGGEAKRISPLPCSKELYPIGFHSSSEDGSLRPKVVSHYLLEKMQLAGIAKTYIILRKGKWDIPAYFGDGKMLNMRLAYLIMDLPFGTPFTLDQAYPFVQDATVALGFPDILFQPEDAFRQLLERQMETGADVVLGVFRTDHPQQSDMVDFDRNGRIHRIVIKPAQTDLCYSWAIAVWTPSFSHFMHHSLAAIQQTRIQNQAECQPSKHRELFVGDVIQAAIEKGLTIESVGFPENSYLDIGTPEGLTKAAQDCALPEGRQLIP